MARASTRYILGKTRSGTSFTEIAQRYSFYPSGKQGGNLGEFGLSQMVKEFDTVVFSAPVGEV